MKRFFVFFLTCLFSVLLVACSSGNSESKEPTKTDGTVQENTDEDTKNIIIYNKFSEENNSGVKYTMVSTITLSYKNDDKVESQTNIYVATPDDENTTQEDIEKDLKNTVLGQNASNDIPGLSYGFDSQEKDVILTVKIDYETLDFEKFKQTNLYLSGNSADDVLLAECEQKLEEKGFIKRG